MSKNKNKSEGELGELPMQPGAPEASNGETNGQAGSLRHAGCGAPVVLDFRLDRPWRIERFEDLAAEFHMEHSEGDWSRTAKEFVLVAREHARQWLVLRRLFGIAPVIPLPGTAPDDLRCWSRAELAGQGYEVQAELDALRAIWGSHTRREESVLQPETQSTAQTAVPKGELSLDDKVLEKFNFSDRIFKINVWDAVERKDIPRPEAENRAERDWFVRRVSEWGKMLGNDIAGPIARDALMNELYLRRLEGEIATCASKDVDKLYDRRAKLSSDYQDKVDRLQTMFPELAVAGKVSFRAVVSDLVAAQRDYYAHADRRLVDKVFTVAEIEFGLRTSLQVSARHRFGLNVAINQCIHHLYDPEFKQQIKPSVFAQIDAGFRGAVAAVREAQAEPVVDLEKGVAPGEGDQFDDFNDAVCPECQGRISSALKKCPYCGLKNPNDVVVEEAVMTNDQ